MPVPQKGYGAALRGGIAAARGRYIIMGDADDSYDFSALDAFVETLRGGATWSWATASGAASCPARCRCSTATSAIRSSPSSAGCSSGRRSGDFHCGLRGFTRDASARLDLRTTGMEFASEMVVKATLHGMRIAEVPTTLKPDGRSRPPHLKHLARRLAAPAIPADVLAALAVLDPRHDAMLARHADFDAALLGTTLSDDNLALDLNTFVAACFMVMTGVQLVTFGILSRYYAEITGILPSNTRSDWLIRHVSTDRLVINANLLLAGILFFGYAIISWRASASGRLPIRRFRGWSYSDLP